MKRILGIIILIITAVIPQLLMPEAGIVLALAPFVIPAAMAALGGLGNLFGGNEEEERYKRLLALLEKQKQDVISNSATQTANLERQSSQDKSDRRTVISQNNAKQGIDNPAASFTGEEDIINALYRGMANIDANKTESLQNIGNKQAELEASYDGGESGVSKFFGGAVKGANLGFGINGGLGIGSEALSEVLGGDEDGGLLGNYKNLLKLTKKERVPLTGSINYMNQLTR